MADDPKRPQKISMNDVKSPADRARQIQALQQQLASQEAAPVAKKQEVKQTKAPEQVFAAHAVRKASTDISVPHVPTAQSTYANAQVPETRLFAGDPIEITGNPWKVISFKTMLPVIFDPKKVETGEAKVPKNAVKTENGLLFQIGLETKGGKTEHRAVLTTPRGELLGADCQNLDQVKTLLSRSPELRQKLAAKAFQDTFDRAEMINIAVGKGSAYEVTFRDGLLTRTVPVNNFVRPLSPFLRGNITAENYHLDKYECAA